MRTLSRLPCFKKHDGKTSFARLEANLRDEKSTGAGMQRREAPDRQMEAAAPRIALARLLMLWVLALAGVFILSRPGVTSYLLLCSIAALVAWLGSQACADLGRQVNIVRAIGVDAILCVLLPSFLVDRSMFPPEVVDGFSVILNRLDLLNWIVIVFVLGGVASVDRAALGQLGVRLILPVVVSSIAALLVGAAVAGFLFPDLWTGFAFHVLPAMVGGIAAGALPLALGYADMSTMTAGDALSKMLPTLFATNFCGIIVAAVLGYTGARPQHAEPVAHKAETKQSIWAALMLIIGLYVAGSAIDRWLHIPSALTITLAAVVLVLSNALPPALRAGAVAISDFTTRHLLFPLLWIVGIVIISWDGVVAGLAPEILLTAIAIVFSLALAGAATSHLMKIDPVDGAVVALSRGAIGGTGAAMMLKAANRLGLFPYAIVAVRIGGALTLALALKLAGMAPH